MDLDLNPRLAALSEAERAEYHATIAKASPVERLLIKELVWQGTQIGKLTVKCDKSCKKRFESLERAKVLVYGLIGIVPPVALIAWWIFERMGRGGKP